MITQLAYNENGRITSTFSPPPVLFYYQPINHPNRRGHMKKNKQNTILAGLLILNTLTLGCKSTGSTAATPAAGGAGSSTALTAADVAGTHIAPCLPTGSSNTYGTSANGLSFYKMLTLNANGTFSLNTLLFSTPSCIAGGGAEILVLTIAGTFTMGSLLTSGATGVLYVQTASNMTVYGGATGNGTTSFGNGWVSSINNGCPGGPTFSSGTSSSHSMSNITCNTNGLSFPAINADGTNFYDAISTASGFAVSPSLNVFMMGQFSSYPATASFSYTN